MLSRVCGSLLVGLLVLWVCGPAYGYAFQYRVNVPHPDEDYLAFTSETVSVDLYLDAEPGLNSFEVGVLWDEGLYVYDPALTTAPSYILYDPGAGMSAASYLAPFRWGAWPSPPPGREQFTVRFLSSEGLRLAASASGQDIWIASLVFHVAQPVYGSDSFEVSLGVAGTGVFVGGSEGSIPFQELDPADVPITRIPEPVTAVLLSAAVAFVALFGLRRV